MRVKGSALRGRQQYVREKGESAYHRWLQQLSPPAREATEAGYLANEWYPFELFVELCESIDQLFGSGDLSLCFDQGYYSCDQNLPTLYRMFFRVGSVGYIITRAQVAWRVTYDTGSIEVVERKDKSAVLEIKGWPDPRRPHCLSVLGWMIRAGEISGGQNLEWDEHCRALGHDHCRFHVRWD